MRRQCIPPSGDFPSCCTGCATIRTSGATVVSAFEHCDMVAATLCGITDPKKVKRSICAMGHKWMWNAELGGLPPEDFLTSKSIRCSTGVRAKAAKANMPPPIRSPGQLSPEWAERLGFASPEFPSPSARSTRTGTRSARAPKKATSSTWSALPPASSPYAAKADLVPGVCGVVQGSVHPEVRRNRSRTLRHRRYF